MSPLDQVIVAAYLLATLAIGLMARERRRSRGDRRQGVSYLLAGRRLTLFGFVATMVSTWYGGILGVGEYTFKYGLSSWIVFGVPYYVAAALFALFVAARARKAASLTLPEQLHEAYGRGPGGFGAAVVLATTLPAAYVLSFGVLLELAFGLPLHWGIVLGGVFSVVYLWRGGFEAVVRTDLLQFALMFTGFVMLLGVLIADHGALPFLAANVPPAHWSWSGGRTAQAVAVWYVIALATLVEPSFYQRCFAAESPQVARRGLLLSILFWLVFDLLTTATGLYARALLADLPPDQAIEAFPRLAALALPVGLVGLFHISMLATVMSTVDSYLFIAASTVGRDLLARLPLQLDVTAATRVGLVTTGAATVGIALASESVVSLWHAFGTVATCTLLVPVVGAFVPGLRMSPRAALVSMASSFTLSLAWLLSGRIGDAYWLDLEPIYPGLGLAALVWAADRAASRLAARRGC
ncbi:MAG: hypothetical protein CSA66_02680 [Proteobacteria bacterium]|nr:MAG: hypothetical protein CSA66_02680 [Pseudomonadota bacterium]